MKIFYFIKIKIFRNNWSTRPLPPVTARCASSPDITIVSCIFLTHITWQSHTALSPNLIFILVSIEKNNFVEPTRHTYLKANWVVFNVFIENNISQLVIHTCQKLAGQLPGSDKALYPRRICNMRPKYRFEAPRLAQLRYNIRAENPADE